MFVNIIHMILVTNIVVVLGCLHLIFSFSDITNRRLCVNHPDNFCHVCGQFSPQDQRKNISKRLKTAYKHYFSCQLRDQDKTWAPHVCCTVCYSGLNGKWKKMPFAVPMV